MVKNLPAMHETWIQSLGQEDPLQKEMQPIPVFLPGNSHGQKSFVGYSPELQSMGSQRVRTTEYSTKAGKELDMTEGT